MDESAFRADKIADRLRHNTMRGFVGRGRECALFRQAIEAPEPQFAILHVAGPGGIGKTRLLHAFRAIAEEAGVPVGLVDARDIEASPLAFEDAACHALGFHPQQSEGRQRHFVLMLDSFDALSPLRGWLMRSFVPAMPSSALVVIASRSGGTGGIAYEPGWEGLVCTLRLRNFDPTETAQFLAERGVADEMHVPILRMSYGHPLALAIAADTLSQGGSLGESQRLELIATLLDRLVEAAPSAEHRTALEICSHARITTEAMLADAIGREQGESLFGWLKGLSFIETGSEGVFPHDLARDVIHSDLVWRNPTRMQDIHIRTRRHLLRLYREGTQAERLRALRDIVYLHRLNPIMRSYFEFRAMGHVYAEPATEADHPGILALIASHEGQASAAVARHWLVRQPDAFIAMRSVNEPLAGLLCHLDLTRIDRADAAVDPIAREALSALEAAGQRPGETAILDRFIMAADSYQSPSPAMTAAQIQSYLFWMTTPRLSWAFLAVDLAAQWDDLMRYIDFAPASREIAGIPPRHFILYGHDWRRVPPTAWFEMMEQREIETAMRPEELRSPGIDVVVLSEPQFRDAVRDALRQYSDEASLAANPLLRSRLLMSGEAPVLPRALKERILAAAELLMAGPKDRKFFRALDVTFLNPAGSQEIAAERLGLPFGTYRYRLSVAIEKVTDLLWRQEVGAAD